MTTLIYVARASRSATSTTSRCLQTPMPQKTGLRKTTRKGVAFEPFLEWAVFQN